MSASRRIRQHQVIESDDEDLFVPVKRARRTGLHHPQIAPQLSRTASPEARPAKTVQANAEEPPQFESNTAKLGAGPIANVPAAPAVRTYQDVLGNHFVKLYISPSKTPFTIHKALLASNCPAFVASLKIPTVDVQIYEHRTPFLDFSVVAFAGIVEFLYKRVVPLVNRMRSFHAEITRLMAIYEVAEMMAFRLAKNVLVTQIGILYVSKEMRPSIADVRFSYTHTQKDCGLRKLVAGHLACVNLTAGKKGKKSTAEGKRGGAVKDISPDDINVLMAEFPELGADIVHMSNGWFVKTGTLRSGNRLICEVHEHSEGRSKCCRDDGLTWSDRVGDDGEAEE